VEWNDDFPWDDDDGRNFNRMPVIALVSLSLVASRSGQTRESPPILPFSHSLCRYAAQGFNELALRPSDVVGNSVACGMG